MIHAVEALRLERAHLTDEEQRQVQALIARIEEHVRGTMTYVGPAPLKLLFPSYSANVVKAACNQMILAGWETTVTLAAVTAAIPGAPPTPHSWKVEFVPGVESYDSAAQAAGGLPRADGLPERA